MNSKTDLGQFISEKKRKKKLQSQELAKILGVSVPYLSQIEHGKRRRNTDVRTAAEDCSITSAFTEIRSVISDLSDAIRR